MEYSTSSGVPHSCVVSLVFFDDEAMIRSKTTYYGETLIVMNEAQSGFHELIYIHALYVLGAPVEWMHMP